jgi:hypothetical protein
MPYHLVRHFFCPFIVLPIARGVHFLFFQKCTTMDICFSAPSAPTLRPEDKPVALFEPHFGGEFANGLTAEGISGAAGRRFCLLFSL